MKATDALLDRVTLRELAQKLRVSESTIKQARVKGTSEGHRNPPEYWENGIKALAENRIKHFQQLVWQMEKEIQAKARRTLTATGDGSNVAGLTRTASA